MKDDHVVTKTKPVSEVLRDVYQRLLDIEHRMPLGDDRYELHQQAIMVQIMGARVRRELNG